MSKDSGHSAFPNEFGPLYNQPGLTKREWFAGQALIGFLASNAPMKEQENPDKIVAIAAYLMADAMIAEGEKP